MNQFASGVNSAVNHLRATTNQWHHPHISRAEGAQLLEGSEAGSFILRESSKGGSYALSVILPNSGALGHYLVEKRGPECFCLQGSENSFSTIEELLAHYHHHDSIGLPCRLRLPQRHSSSMSYPARPSLPPLPPRNNSRASSVSRPSFNRSKVPGGSPSAAAAAAAAAVAGVGKMGPQMGGAGAKSQPHLDPRRPFEDPNHVGFSPPQAIPHGSHPTHGGHPVPHGHPHASHSPLSTHSMPSRPSTAPPISPSIPASGMPPTHISPAGSLSGGCIPPGGSLPPSMVPAHAQLAHGMDGDGETYEDMTAGRLRQPAGSFVMPSSVHAPHDDECGETYEDMASGRLSGAAPHVANDDEFGETYEDMASAKLAAVQPAVAHADEFGETYEDMATSLRGAPPLNNGEDEVGETYEDMSSMHMT